MHNNQNLVQIRAKNIGDFARQVLQALYSPEELVSSILPPGGNHYSRKCLDPTKFEKLHGKYERIIFFTRRQNYLSTL